ncbi:glycosyltransferase [Adhaeribacter rhizoryzae]|uniref:Glycosyltransferase n=1 Tax=Adhaeribacter rhizoryzae TaxID=2607907 RepID=A0A5M6DRA7_9BACT|nr:glycosyltransferase [Adhaeribacter rhizoryzae]KAA5548730.1 glycosyltransferase [Adhaeribacter rhizoryzae]
MAETSNNNANAAKVNTSNSLLTELAWEVCNQVGGIYTVIRSKVPSMIQTWGDCYCLIGPYFHHNAQAEFEPTDDYSGPFGQAVLKMRNMGFEVHYGHWLVTGNPLVVLLNPYSVYDRLGQIKYDLWHHHHIPTPGNDDLLNQVEAFGYLAKTFLQQLVQPDVTDKNVIAHFHEWMVGPAIPELRRERTNIRIIFTTHATLLGRYLAMNDPSFYDNLTSVNWLQEAIHFNIETAVKLERAAAHGAHIFSTVSDVTARECMFLLERIPDVILPNGLNIQRFIALHEHQNLHQKYKDKIHQFVMAHFFQSYPFDLDQTLYFFTSGRYEYRNKGFDVTLEALARLNYRMQQAGIKKTVVMFFITKQPYHSVHPGVLQSRVMMEEIRETCVAIQKEIGKKLFYAAASSTDFKLPALRDFVDDYWQLRYRRTLQSWKTHNLPSVVTHNLVNDKTDEILHFLRSSNLVNNAHDRVKIVYHPDFVSVTNPLFAMDYGQFVRGCHMGVFPSYYEPWGYTPLECIARGVPAVTSDLSGFGDYVMGKMDEKVGKGIFVVKRRNRSFDDAANQLADYLFEYVQYSQRDRIALRNQVESSSEEFDWKNLTRYYNKAYQLAMEKPVF